MNKITSASSIHFISFLFFNSKIEHKSSGKIANRNVLFKIIARIFYSKEKDINKFIDLLPFIFGDARSLEKKVFFINFVAAAVVVAEKKTKQNKKIHKFIDSITVEIKIFKVCFRVCRYSLS